MHTSGAPVVDAEVVESEVASTPEEVPPESRGRGLDVRAPPFYPSVAHASVAQAVGAFRAELQAWMALRAVPVTWPTRSGGRQRRAARRRRRATRVCYVGGAEAERRFMARAEARGWLMEEEADESDYFSAEEGEPT